MSFHTMGDDIAALLEHLKIPKADLVGHSFGGASAIRAAIQHPEKVRRLVVISSPYARSGWYPEAQRGMSQVGAGMAVAVSGLATLAIYNLRRAVLTYGPQVILRGRSLQNLHLLSPANQQLPATPAPSHNHLDATTKARLASMDTISAAQLAANQANAQLSTGPKSEEGKRRSG